MHIKCEVRNKNKKKGRGYNIWLRLYHMVADWFFAVKWLIIGLIATAAVNKAIAIMFQYNKADFFLI